MNLIKIIYLFTSVSLLLLVVNAQLTASAELDESKVLQGEKVGLTLTLQNTGIDRIGEINLYVNNSALDFARNITIPSLFPNSKYTKILTITVPTSTTPGTYDVATSIYYEGKTTLLISNLEVLQFPLQVSYKLDKGSVGVGEEDKLMVEISNVGDSDLDNVLVNLMIPDKFKLETSNNITVTILTPHETVSKNFFFTPLPGADGDYNIISEISFRDQDEIVHSDSDFIVVTVGSGIGLLETVILIIILVVLVSLFIRRIA